MNSIKNTKIFNENEVDSAAELLSAGELLAFPTETVYGLGADALNPRTVNNIFVAKGRPADNPLIIHIADQADLKMLTDQEISPLIKKVIDQFWPGPLTIVLKKSSLVPEVTTGSLDTVAIRMPNHPIALRLIKEAGVPVAAPSANLSGKPSPTLADHVIEDLAGRIDGILDGGQTGIGLESTVMDLSKEVPTLLRPGGVTYEELTEVLGRVEIDPAVESKLDDISKKAISPGMKYKHYAPQAEVLLLEGDSSKIKRKIKEIINKNSNKKIGVMITIESIDDYEQAIVKIMGSRDDLSKVSQNIFKLLREFDADGVDQILIEGLVTEGLGLAIMNRLRKSAGYQILEV